MVRRSVRVALLALLVAGGLATAPAGAQAACSAPSGAAAIAAENANPGTPQNEWDIQGAGSASLQGFATEISVDCGSPVQFKIDSSAGAYRLDIYRMGYYAGNGARKVDTVTPTAAQITAAQNQPSCATDTSTGRTDCGNWAVSATWNVPSNAVSGIYFARVVSTAGAAASHIVFVVRNDASTSDIQFQTSDTTWQAYNRYGEGGSSLYTGGPTTGPLAGIGRAVKVSYNRPFTTRDYSPEDWVFNAEYPMVRWLERNGYDVSYSTGVDSDARPAQILQHKTFLSVGHDEYWSGTQRANVEAARNAGRNLAFFSGNEVFWKTRWEDGHRTLVSYKETHAGEKIDPQTSVWTGTWRDPRPFNPQGGSPENALTGTIFTVNEGTVTLQVPEAEGKLRLWRGTPVAGQTPGQTMSLAADTLGYEWDEDLDNGARPAGLVQLSSTAAAGIQKLQDYGSVYGAGSATHHLTLYRDTNGAGPDALVFGAGTVQWSWGLDSAHDRGSASADVSMQQAMVNLMADMGAQPATRQADLAAASPSTDMTAPSTSITSPADGSAVPAGTSIIHGTATDAGGRVGGVEVSVDGGTTWHPANGRESWSYTWTPAATGRTTLLARAADDSANLGSQTAVSVNVGSQGCPCSLFGTAPMAARSADAAPVEVGVRFRADDDGYITALRYYRPTGVSGTHIGHLWTSGGTKLAEATFVADTQPGWHQVALPTPVQVSAGATYVASYFASEGGYSEDPGFFADAFDAPPLHAPGSTSADPNGVYVYTATGGFPTNASDATNYGADVVFVRTDHTAPTVLSVAPADGADAVSPSTQVRATFDEALAASTLDGFTFQLRDGAGAVVPAAVTYDAATRTAVLTPSAPLAGSVRYSATVKGGAVGVSDAAGNPLAQDRTWSFTTALVQTALGNESGSKSSKAGPGAGGSNAAGAGGLRVTVTPRSVRASSAGTVKLRVACPRRARSCRIKLRLRLGRRDIASKTLTVSGGHSKIFVLKLNAKARRDLRRKGSLAVTAIAAVRDKAGKSATTRTSIRLLAPGRR
jgi:hypothetical protein